MRNHCGASIAKGLAVECKDQGSKIKIAESPFYGDDFLSFTFYSLHFDFGWVAIP